jgi:hypothetical protein
MSSPFGRVPAHGPPPNLAPAADATAPAPSVTAGTPQGTIEPITAKIPLHLSAAYLQPTAGQGSEDPTLAPRAPSASAAGTPGTPTPLSLGGASIPGTNIPRPYFEPSAQARPISPAAELLAGLRKLVAGLRPVQQRLFMLRTPMPLIVATVVTLFVGGLLAIVLLSPTENTKRPAPAAQITGRFFNPAWTRQSVASPPDTATADTATAPSAPTTAEPSATASSGSSMAPPEPTGADTSPDKRGKTGPGKSPKQRPKWF